MTMSGVGAAANARRGLLIADLQEYATEAPALTKALVCDPWPRVLYCLLNGAHPMRDWVLIRSLHSLELL